MKVPFFFRTREEYEKAKDFVEKLNEKIRKKVGWDSLAWVHLTSKYNVSNEMYMKIPKRKATDKKYLAVLRTNKEKIDRLGINLEYELAKLGFELQKRTKNKPKFGETTTKEIKLKSHDEFRALASVLNNAFGNDNWRLRGPKKTIGTPGLQQLLKRLQEYNERTTKKGAFFGMAIVGEYKDGVPVKIIVNQPDVDLNKYLFKVKLKA